MFKKCNKCAQMKELSEYYVNTRLITGHYHTCKECFRAQVRANQARKKDYYKEYDWKRGKLNITRILNHRFLSFKSRVEGRNGKVYRVTGKPMCTREEYNAWCEANRAVFEKLHKSWVDSGFSNKLVPSIDRIDNNRGYTIDNIQWLTKSANSSKGSK